MSDSAHDPSEPPPFSWRHALVVLEVCGLGVLGALGFLLVSDALSLQVFPNGEGAAGLGVALVPLIVGVSVDRPDSRRRRMLWLIAATPVAVIATGAGALAVAALLGWHEGDEIGGLVRHVASMGAAGFTMVPLVYLISTHVIGPPERNQYVSHDPESQ